MTRAEQLRAKAAALLADARLAELAEKRRARKERTRALILLGTVVAGDHALVSLAREKYHTLAARDAELVAKYYPGPPEEVPFPDLAT